MSINGLSNSSTDGIPEWRLVNSDNKCNAHGA